MSHGFPHCIIKIDDPRRPHFYGSGRDFRGSAVRSGKGGDFVTKLPVIIQGQAGAMVWVPREERGRVALLFGDVRQEFPADAYRVEDGARKVHFEPCRRQEADRMAWRICPQRS